MADPPGGGEIRAAGALLWRPSGQGRRWRPPGRGREVALIHRPKYDDWTFPKGKRDLGEYVLLTAVRAALERSRVALCLEAEMRVLRDRYASLSQRERQVMELVVSGLLNKQVGGELGISEITVKAHRGKVMQKMKADSLADLVKMSARLRPAPPAIRAA